jgi:hypothetical protein
MAFTVEKSGALPALVIVAAVEEGRTIVEMAASQAPLEPPAGAGSGGADVVMVPSDLDSAPPPPAGDHEVAMPEPSPTAGAAEPSSAAGVVTVEEVMELARASMWTSPASGSSTLTSLSSRATTRRCWRWRRSGCLLSRQSWRPLCQLR